MNCPIGREGPRGTRSHGYRNEPRGDQQLPSSCFQHHRQCTVFTALCLLWPVTVNGEQMHRLTASFWLPCTLKCQPLLPSKLSVLFSFGAGIQSLQAHQAWAAVILLSFSTHTCYLLGFLLGGTKEWNSQMMSL